MLCCVYAGKHARLHARSHNTRHTRCSAAARQKNWRFPHSLFERECVCKSDMSRLHAQERSKLKPRGSVTYLRRRGECYSVYKAELEPDGENEGGGGFSLVTSSARFLFVWSFSCSLVGTSVGCVRGCVCARARTHTHTYTQTHTGTRV